MDVKALNITMPNKTVYAECNCKNANFNCKIFE